jgi:hypothetical protein
MLARRKLHYRLTMLMRRKKLLIFVLHKISKLGFRIRDEMRSFPLQHLQNWFSLSGSIPSSFFDDEDYCLSPDEFPFPYALALSYKGTIGTTYSSPYFV